MSINIKVSTIAAHDIAEKKAKAKLQFIPAKIKTESTEPLNISNYFNNYTIKENDVLLNSLRGFPLKGVTSKVPEHYTGVVFKETQKPLSDATERSFKVEHVFDEFTYWNYDKIPSKNDALHKALDYIKVANVLHEPVNPDDMKAEPDIELKSEDSTES